MQPNRRRIGDILVGWGRLSLPDLDRALRLQREDPARPRLGEVLLREHLCDEQTIAAALAERHGMRVVDLQRIDVDNAVARTLDRASAVRYRAVPIAVTNGVTVVAVADPFDVISADDLRARYHNRVTFIVAMPTQIQSLQNRIWGDETRAAVVHAFVGRVTGQAVTGPEVDDEGAVGIVDQILADADHRRASDVHIEPTMGALRVRFRIDGIMHLALELPPASLAPISSRVKVMSGLDVFKKRVPQDGRARVQVHGKDLDIRVSTVPTIHGENLVLRLMTSQKDLPDIATLGLSWEQVDTLTAAMSKPQGFVVVTGPTGSGKSTTLYSLLSSYVGPERNAITMEDPVELELFGVTQVQIEEANGVTFPAALRAALRQDPDVVMVGEVRDEATASMAVSAALTGHLVLSTLHTLDGPSAVVRLIQLGVPNYLIADALSLVVAQRLLRRPCPMCAHPSMPDSATMDHLGVTPEQAAHFVAGAGCEMCGQTGYLGRVGAYELLPITPQVRGVIHAGGTAPDVARAAMSSGYIPLQTAAVRLGLQGLTTAEEVMRTVVAPALDVAVQ